MEARRRARLHHKISKIDITDEESVSGGNIAHPLEIPRTGRDIDAEDRRQFTTIQELVGIRGLDVEAVSEARDVVVYEHGLALADVQLKA